MNIEHLSAAGSEAVANELEQVRPPDLQPLDVVFLVCRSHRVDLVKYLIQAQDESGQKLAVLLNDALLYVFIHGDWDNPYLLQESDYDIEPARLWKPKPGPISVAMAEMARFLGNVQYHCPKIWTWIDIKPFVRRYLANDYRNATFERGAAETMLFR